MTKFDKETKAKIETVAKIAITVMLAGAGVAATLALGITVGTYMAPRPCLQNMHSSTYPTIRFEQEWLENKTLYPADSEFAKAGILSPNHLAYKVVEGMQDSKFPPQIYQNPVTGREFHVPGLCYFELDVFGDPILYRKS